MSEAQDLVRGAAIQVAEIIVSTSRAEDSEGYVTIDIRDFLNDRRSEKSHQEKSYGRLDKAKGRLQQSFPEIQQLIKTSNVVEAARKVIDLAHSIFQQFASDIQLKDLSAKAEALVAKGSPTVATVVLRNTAPTEAPPSELPANKLPSKKAVLKKSPSKGARPKKPPKKTPSRRRQSGC